MSKNHIKSYFSNFKATIFAKRKNISFGFALYEKETSGIIFLNLKDLILIGLNL